MILRASACRLSLVLAVLIALGGGQVTADELVTRDGDRYRGHAVTRGQEVLLNPYGSTAPGMTLGQRRFRVRDVLEIRADGSASSLFRQLDALAPTDIEGRVRALRSARTNKHRELVKRIAAEILGLRADHPEALDAIRSQKAYEALRARHPELHPTFLGTLRTVIRLRTGDMRQRAAAALETASGHAVPAHLVERMEASLRRDRGRVAGIPLRIEAETFPGATYDRFVPNTYDPVVPRPLLLALHGGGIRTVDKGPVVGSGKDALAFFEREAEKAGWIVIAPTAVEGPWTTGRNMAFLGAVLDQVVMRWNVDLDRVHLAGQGGGADGAWMLASREAARFASVGIAAGGDPRSANVIARKTGLWLYHGDEDAIVPVAPVRKTADKLLRSKADFVYCELPGERHGLPPVAVQDYFAFAGSRRRARTEDPWPSGSFEQPPSKMEVAAFGDPAGAWGTTIEPSASPEDLLRIMRAGKYDAVPAATRLAERGKPSTELGASVRALLRDPNALDGARIAAARALGIWRDPEAINPVGDVLRAGASLPLMTQCAWAAGQIASPDNTEDLRFALLDIARRYKAIRGRAIPYAAFERASELGQAIVEALGRVAKAEAVQADIEESLVIGILRDPRRVIHRTAAGEDPIALRAALARSIARAYRALKVEGTLYDMLFTVVRANPRVLTAAQAGRREGLR